MASPSTIDAYVNLVRRSGLVEPQTLDAYLQRRREDGSFPQDLKKFGRMLVRDGMLTLFQAEQILRGKWRGFTLGKYKILERLGAGGVGSVYLCEHQYMRRRVAVKVLPIARAEDPTVVRRFYREARAAAALDHPNIVRAHDIDQDNGIHFLVMEYIDGLSLHEIGAKHGPMDINRAAHYIRQTAVGLQHIHKSGLIHRDIKPGNLLLDRKGTVKILDLGLARFFHDQRDPLTQQFDSQTILGTADYLSPEQAINSHGVDIRTDIYSLGATLYYLLAGCPPYEGKSLTKKLLLTQMERPKPIQELRPEVPEELAFIIDKMMAKKPADRYQEPASVAEVLMPWTQAPIPAPPADEMPRLSPAASRSEGLNAGPIPVSTARSKASLAPARAAVPTGAGNGAPIPGAAVAVAQVNRDIKPPANGYHPPSDPGNGGTRLAVETDHGLAHADTDPDLTRVSARMRPTNSKTLAATKLWRRLPSRPVLIAASTALGVLVIAILWWALSGPGEPAPVELANLPPVAAAPPNTVPATKPRPPATTPQPPPSATTHVVDSRGSSLRTVREALAKAKPGDRIVVQSETHEEKLHLLDGKLPTRVTIEGRAASGKLVSWRPPAEHPPTEPLFHLVNAEGLRLKGFHFDGQNRTNDLVVLTGRCPGLCFEDVHLEGFSRSAIRLMNCAGEDAKPVSLLRVRASTLNEPETALLFEADPNAVPQINQFIEVRECRLEGPYAAAVTLAGPVANVEFHRNRFYKVVDGFRYKRAEPLHRLHLTLISNTFHDAEKAIHFETMPPVDSANQMVVKNNLFSKTATLAHVDDFKPAPAQVKAQWIWYPEGTPLKGAPEEKRYFRKTFDITSKSITRATLDIVCDDGFTVWINGEQVGQGQLLNLTKRVHAFNVASYLRPGNNVIAVYGYNLKAPDGGMTATGLLAQLTYASSDGASTLIHTDVTWKVSKDSPQGWQKPEFDDGKWLAAKMLTAYGRNHPQWHHLVWESVVQRRFKGAAQPVIPNPSGNIRDQPSKESYPLLEARAMNFALPTDPTHDARFLRYPKTEPLFHAGPGKTPVGLPQEDN